jgi:endo-1,4-beta-xylanase
MLRRSHSSQTAGACAQAESCVGLTLWDFYDPFSWVPYFFEGEGQALLWFEDFSLHPAYYGVVAALKNATGKCAESRRRDFALPFYA